MVKYCVTSSASMDTKRMTIVVKSVNVGKVGVFEIVHVFSATLLHFCEYSSMCSNL